MENRTSTSLPLTATLAVALLVGALGAAGGYYLAGPGAVPSEPLTATGLDPAAPREKIVLAIQPTDNPASIQDKARDLEAFLEQRTGDDIEIVIPLTYTGTVEALRFGHAHAAFMGSWPARLAFDVAKADIVLAEQREVIIDGKPTVAPYYHSYYVVLKDSPYQTLEDVRGKTVAYPSMTSGSGYLYPVSRLVDKGLIPGAADGKAADPKGFFGEVLFAGGYGQAWQALKNGQADVAVTAGDINANLFQEVMAGTRIIETQGPVPSHAVVFAEDFRGAPADRLKAALLELKGEHKDLMRKLVSGIFVEFAPTTTAEHTEALRHALTNVGLRHQDRIG